MIGSFSFPAVWCFYAAVISACQILAEEPLDISSFFFFFLFSFFVEKGVSLSAACLGFCFSVLLVNLCFICGSFPFLTCAVRVDRYNISSGRWSEVMEAGSVADQPWPLYAHSAVMFEVGAPQVILVLVCAGLNLVLPVTIQI